MNYEEDIYRAIIDILEERKGEIVSTGLIKKEMKEDDSKPDIHPAKINEPVEDLLVLGEVTLIWAQQAGRITLNKSVNLGTNGQSTLANGVWRCYIAKDHQERYHSGLFESKNAAEEYLRKMVGDNLDELESVPFCNNVHITEKSGFEGYGTHTVVIRGERIHNQLPLEIS